ncbi:receptor-interacting serine/threonine-protein kinase 3-like isoform X2 [Dendropsophus ebraccatus]|uniref:receptor-interacting serine/threonine-protein kinase 3-like isoform X2 n=1 Tax=Dendropsophus ebraccatus TaxID=150705 RepID=UPI003831681C
MNKKNLIPVTLLTDWVPIDQGHFGSVYKATHKEFKVPVAVKKLKCNVPEGLKELISEAEKMASASTSPYVIRLYGILEENAQPIPVTIGMNWLHNLPTPLLHLDLKTKNVLLTEELYIKITDFGLSKYTRGSSTLGFEDCEGVGGTLEYMPPEAFQEGYQPSPLTDVYSFAILSAVVLRGENPYPVDKSVLIRQLVPQGQRPCLKDLENETSVKYLKEAIEFTKLCWHNDKLKRPVFSECCNKWERFSSAFDKCEIRQAVRAIQDSMDSSISSGKATDIPHTTGDTTSVNTKGMSEIFQKLSTMNISERPDVLLESAPVMNSPNVQSQHIRGQPQTSQPGHLQGAVGYNYRPQPTYDSGPAMKSPNLPSQHSMNHPRSPATGSNFRAQNPQYTAESVPVNSPNVQSQHIRGQTQTIQQSHLQGAVGYNYRPQPTYHPAPAMNSPNVPSQHSMIHPTTPAMGSSYRTLNPQYTPGAAQFWLPTFPPRYTYQHSPNYFFPQSFQPNTSTINISNCTNFQIGDNTSLTVTDSPHPGPYRNMSSHQPVQTIRIQKPTPTSPKQKQTTQAASHDQPSKQENIVKSEQSNIHPIQTKTEGHSSNVNGAQVTQGSMSTIENPTTQKPEQ